MVSAMIAITGTVSIAISLITPPPLHHHPKLHVRHGEHRVSFRYDAEHGSYIRIDRQFYPGLPLSRPKYPVPSRSLPGVSTYRSPLYPLYSSVSRPYSFPCCCGVGGRRGGIDQNGPTNPQRPPICSALSVTSVGIRMFLLSLD